MMTEAVEIRHVGTDEGVDLLRRAPNWGRGFLGVDPVAQNAPLMARLLDEAGAEIYQVATGGQAVALAGCVRGGRNPRQACVAVAELPPPAAPGPREPGEPAPAFAPPQEVADVIVRFLRFLAEHRQIGTFVTGVLAGDPAVPGLTASGFREVGRLREHVYRSGRYHDLHVLFAGVNDLEHRSTGCVG
jgi:hypothetical protein